MTGFKRILVILDPRLEWTPALERASALAHATGAAVWLGLFHHARTLPWHPSLRDRAAHVAKSSRDEMSARLESLAKRFRAQSGADVDVIDDDHRANCLRIMGFVERHRIDLVLKDAGHDSAAARLVFVPLDWELLRESAVPVWLCAPSDAPLPRSIAVAVDPAHAVHGAGTINDAILSTAAELSRTTGASIQVYTAFEGLTFQPTFDPFGLGVGWTQGEIVQRMRADHQAAFDELLRRHAIPPDNGLLLHGSPGPAILERMQKRMAEILVIGAIHRHGMERAFIGSTAEYLVSRAPCDILAVPGIASADHGTEAIIV